MVVSNTSPLNYLVQIGGAHMIPALHGAVHVPQAVVDELSDAAAPDAVRAWVASPPSWLVIHADPIVQRPEWAHIHRGESAAIALALELGASLLFMDDLDGRIEARKACITVMGTLGVLDAAAVKGLADFQTVLAALQSTNFRASRKLVNALLLRHSKPEDAR
jgi:predicted nucleic acid-binding protein